MECFGDAISCQISCVPLSRYKGYQKCLESQLTRWGGGHEPMLAIVGVQRIPGVAPLAIDLGRVAADVEARCGLKRSALSRLENDKTHNPTFLTLQRYATALGLTLRTALANRTGASTWNCYVTHEWFVIWCFSACPWLHARGYDHLFSRGMVNIPRVKLGGISLPPRARFDLLQRARVHACSRTRVP